MKQKGICKLKLKAKVRCNIWKPLSGLGLVPILSTYYINEAPSSVYFVVRSAVLQTLLFKVRLIFKKHRYFISDAKMIIRKVDLKKHNHIVFARMAVDFAKKFNKFAFIIFCDYFLNFVDSKLPTILQKCCPVSIVISMWQRPGAPPFCKKNSMHIHVLGDLLLGDLEISVSVLLWLYKKKELLSMPRFFYAFLNE